VAERCARSRRVVAVNAVASVIMFSAVEKFQFVIVCRTTSGAFHP